MAGQADEVVEFCLRWNLNADAEAKVLSLAPEVQKYVMENFAPMDGMTEVNGKLIKFAVSIDKGFKGTGSLGQNHSSQGSSPGAQMGLEDLLGAFISQWNLNEDSQAKLMKLSPAMQQTVMSGFDPPPHMTEVNGKFIMYCASMDKGKGKGKGAGKFDQQPRFNVPTFGGKAGPLPAGQVMQARPSLVGGRSSSNEVLSFALHWSLNDDATRKLYQLEPEVQGVVMRDFSPLPHMTEVSGKFISFAAAQEKIMAGMQPASGHQKMQSYHQMQPATLQRATLLRMPASAPRAQPGFGGSDAELVAFCQHWALNADAQNKFYSLSPMVQETVMGSFAPPPHMTEVSGKFIMFAASLEKGQPPVNHQRGAKGSKANAASAVQGFAQHWGLNADAQTKLQSLSPDVREAVMAGFAPPPHMSEVSGKFIMFAASLDKARGQKRTFNQMGGLF